ncbi:hypothetical protein AVEN_257583-1 [Araneus ventricosus]|uniref:Uncharacterized protein n=1 Tax=Araneus ventricosus TaxID=182803 RepID=A0A4Y2NPR8_ARAVE|nr:hypothetical protein AVEN_257583-1 [Araneus ventricosus]
MNNTKRKNHPSCPQKSHRPAPFSPQTRHHLNDNNTKRKPSTVHRRATILSSFPHTRGNSTLNDNNTKKRNHPSFLKRIRTIPSRTYTEVVPWRKAHSDTESNRQSQSCKGI